MKLTLEQLIECTELLHKDEYSFCSNFLDTGELCNTCKKGREIHKKLIKNLLA